MERVLSSQEFCDSDRLQEILRYVVEETLAGRADGIKATTIAMEVFDLNISEGSGHSSIVRVSAARLRRKLSYYYASSGQNDPIRIEIDTGAYVPSFTLIEDSGTVGQIEDKTPAEAKTAATRTAGDTSRSVWLRRLGLVVGIVAIVAIVWNRAAILAPDPVVIEKPFVVVLPLMVSGAGKFNTEITAGYLDAVIVDLTQLSGLSVMAAGSALNVASEAIPLQTLRDEQGVSHVLKGTLISQLESLRISVQLIDTGTGQAVWAERFEGSLEDWFALEDKLAKRIAAALSVTLHPDESRRVYLRHTSNPQAMELLRYATLSINPPNERARVETARGLHQRVIDLDPSFAGGYTGMSEVHSYMVLFQHSENPEEDLSRAIAYAQQAIEKDKGFGLAYSMLGLAYALSGQFDLALAQVRRAVALQPGDPLSHQWLGGVLIFAGREDEAVEAMLEALRLDPIEPRTPYLNILGIAYFNAGQYELARDAFERNRERGGPDAPNMEAYRAATYIALGRENKAREVIASLNVRLGEISPEHWIRRWTPAQEKAEKAIDSLYRMGMKNRTINSLSKSP